MKYSLLNGPSPSNPLSVQKSYSYKYFQLSFPLFYFQSIFVHVFYTFFCFRRKNKFITDCYLMYSIGKRGRSLLKNHFPALILNK